MVMLRWDKRDTMVVGASMLLAAVLNLLATSRGPGLTPDSVTYLSAGVNLADGHGLRMLNDEPLTIFPPAMSLVAATGEVLGISAQTTSRLFTTACFMAIVLLTYLLLGKAVRQPALIYGGTVLAAVSPVILDISKMAMSEPPFVVVTLLFLSLLGRVMERKSLSLSEAAGLAGLCWLAFMFRYAGVSLIATGLVVLVVALSPWKQPRALLQIGAFVIAASAVPIAWMLRNHAVDGTYLGLRVDSTESLKSVVQDLVTTFGEWVVPLTNLSRNQHFAIGLLAGVVIIVLVVAAWRRPVDDAAPEDVKALGVTSPYVLSAGLFVLVYVAYMLWAQLTTALDAINSRLLSPIYVPILLIAAACVEWVVVRLRSRSQSLVLPAMLVLAVFVLGQAAMTLRDVRTGMNQGLAFNSLEWTRSKLSQAAASVRDGADEVFYANSPSGLWAATSIQPISDIPIRGYRGTATEGELREFAEQVTCAGADVYLTMYDRARNPMYTNPYTIEELETVVDLKVVATEADGVLYAVEPATDAEGDAPVCKEDSK